MAGQTLKMSNLQKTWNYCRKNGIRKTVYAACERTLQNREQSYVFKPLSEDELREQRKQSEQFQCTFSIVVPAYETQEQYMRELIASVLNQTYANWELLIGDASNTACVKEVVETYSDKRIIYHKLKDNAGISSNTNQILELATGDYVGLLDHDDLLEPNALFEMAKAITKAQEAACKPMLLYSDEDKCSGDGKLFYEPNWKPGLNLDLILSNNYICHFSVIERELIQRLRFRPDYDGAQDYDLILRILQNIENEQQVIHIDKILYHWRCHSGSTAQNTASKQYAYDAGRRAVADYLRNKGWSGAVTDTAHLGFYHITYQPDILSVRKDVGVVGGKLINQHNKITGGIYKSNSSKEDLVEVLYANLPAAFSGYMHRASLWQDAETVDIRCMQIGLSQQGLWEEVTGMPLILNEKTKRIDWKALQKINSDKQINWIELSCHLCEKVRKAGYRVVWNPEMTEKIKN